MQAALHQLNLYLLSITKMNKPTCGMKKRSGGMSLAHVEVVKNIKSVAY
jgi:hypothetical protein